MPTKYRLSIIVTMDDADPSQILEALDAAIPDVLAHIEANTDQTPEEDEEEIGESACVEEVTEKASEPVDSKVVHESDDVIDQRISDYQLNTTMEGRQISSARDEVESELHRAGIIEDPDVDGGLLG